MKTITLTHIALLGAFVTGLSGLVYGAGQITPDQPTPEQQDQKAYYEAHPRTCSTLRGTFFTLADAALLIGRMPSWQSGRVPSFDSKWSQDRMSQAMGRVLTPGEIDIANDLRELDFSIVNDPHFTGRAVPSLTASDTLFVIQGSTGRIQVVGSLNSELLPTVDVAPTMVPPAPPVTRRR